MTSNTAPIYFLLHIPKTAGQTIERHLAAHSPPGWFWQPPAHRSDAAAARLDLSHVRAISGHFVEASLERYFPGREIRRIALLRDPVALQLSLYNYRMMNYLAKGLATYSFDLHLRALPRNFIAHKLLHEWSGISWPVLMAMSDARKYEFLNRMLADFWFVGGHTHCDELIAKIAADLKVPPQAQRRNTSAEWLRQVEWQMLREEDLSPATIRSIRQRNALDQAVWESWQDAGFAVKSVKPAPLAASRRTEALTDELLRPAFLAARFLRRDRPGRARRAASATADKARDAGDWPRAAHGYRAVLAYMPNAPALWMRYGHALMQMGAYGEAEDAFRNAVSLEPDSVFNRQQLGGVLTLQGRAAEATRVLGRAGTPKKGINDQRGSKSKLPRSR